MTLRSTSVLTTTGSRVGPNILTVLVHNIGGPGGLTKAVTVGNSAAHEDWSARQVDDSSWRVVQLPHDYVVEGNFDPLGNVGHGALPVGIGWYRKYIDVPKSDQGKSVWLYFEGVFRNATVYVNGKKVYFQDDGYDPFNVDIKDALNYGGRNVITVRVDASGGEGWWYEGGGIYRHVWLNVADAVHVIPWGVYVTSTVKNVLTAPSAALTIQTDLQNAGVSSKQVTVTTSIVDPDGRVVGNATSQHSAPSNQNTRVVQSVSLASARLWSLSERNLYQAHTTVSYGDNVVDRYNQTFGIRTIRFDADHGFFLNEVPTKLKGTCNHQDFCGVGIALTDSILHWRVKTLRDRLGSNAIRCSHNPMSPAMYQACDELGMLVMDETRHPGDDVETKASEQSTFTHTEHIEKMILRDRNHPSVIMWSMGNEEWAVQNAAYGGEMLKALMVAVHKHDTTRPVTTANNSGTDPGWLVGFGSAEDLLGVNYNYGDFDWLRMQFPGKPIFGSESGSDISCRGVYKTDEVAAHLTSYMTPEHNWKPFAEREFVCGGFVWTGFDYRGETSPYQWPEISSNFGLLDLCGFPKDAAFYYKAWWAEDVPLVHILPHWNWAGKEGQTVPVWCFSNCDQVELFVNGVSQGMQTYPKYGHVQWDNVVYQTGSLKAVGYRNGQVAETSVVTTTGAPSGIRLFADRTLLDADGEDTIPVEVSIIDVNGFVVPTANNQLSFYVDGPVLNAGVGNGDPASHELNQADTRSAFAGLCMVLVKATTIRGDSVLTVTSDGLSGAVLKFKSA